MKVRLRFVGLMLFVCAVVLAADRSANAQCGCATYQIVNKIVYDQVPVTTYRLEYETIMEEQQVTTLRPEWIEELRDRLGFANLLVDHLQRSVCCFELAISIEDRRDVCPR